MGVDVRGGAAGTAVVLDELEAAAACLVREGLAVVEAIERVATGVVAAELPESHLASPRTALAVDASVAAAVGPGGLVGDLTVLEGLGSSVVAAVGAYRAAEAAAAASVALAADTVLAAVGRQAPALLVGFFTLDALGVDVAGALDHLAYDLPELANLVSSGGDGLTAGLAQNPATAPLLLPGILAGGAAGPGLDGNRLDGEEAALRVLADSAAVWGLLRDRGAAVVTEEPRPRSGARPPGDLVAVADDLQQLSDAGDYPGHVRVVEVPQGDHAVWVVEVSGTQVWDPRAGTSPFDVTTDVRLMAQESTVLAEGVSQALATAQAESGRDAGSERVLLAGHSLGGIVAAGLASSPRFRGAHGPVSVLTLGSPVARMPVPATVPVLSLEHAQDPVPRLDGARNPDAAHWTTVTRDLRGYPGEVDTGTGAHATAEYRETAAAADWSDAPSLVAWREEHRAFFEASGGRDPVIRDFRIERATPAR